MKLISVALVIVCGFFSGDSQALDDLLMSVEDRAKIDVMRAGNPQISDNKNSQAVVKEGSSKSQIVEINGFFFKNRDRREKGVVWVNGKPSKDLDLGSNVAVEKISERDKTVHIILKETRSTIPIKAGQKLMLKDGEIRDVY